MKREAGEGIDELRPRLLSSHNYDKRLDGGNLRVGLLGTHLEIDERKQSSRDANEAKPVRRDVSEQLKNATPEQLRKIEDALQRK